MHEYVKLALISAPFAKRKTPIEFDGQRTWITP
jgi:hypothetical protein